MSRRNHKKNTIVGGGLMDADTYNSRSNTFIEPYNRRSYEEAIDAIDDILISPSLMIAGINNVQGPAKLSSINGFVEINKGQTVDLRNFLVNQKRTIRTILAKIPNTGAPAENSNDTAAISNDAAAISNDPVINPNDPAAISNGPVENLNGVTKGNPNVDAINIINNSVIDEGLHGVKLILATNVKENGEVELKTAMEKASREDTNKARFSIENITSKQDFKTKLYQTDKAVGDEFNNIHNKDYETTSIRRTQGKVPSGIELLNMLRRHGKLSDPTYRPIIDAVVKSYNNGYDSLYNDNDTNWINDFAAKEAYYKFINSPSFFAKEQAFQFSKKDNMGIIDSVGNAGTLAMGVAESAGAAVASLANTNTWTPFKTILNDAIQSLGSFKLSISSIINVNEIINAFCKMKDDKSKGGNDPINEQFIADKSTNPQVKSLLDSINSVYDEFKNFYTTNVVNPIQASMDKVTMPTININEIKTNIHNHITQLIKRITKNRGELTMLNAGEVIVFSPFLIVGGLSVLGLGAVGSIIIKSGKAIGDGSQTIASGLSAKWDKYKEQIAATNQGRKTSALNAIMQFLVDNNETLGIRFKFALANLWDSINGGMDSAIEWNCGPGDISFDITNKITNIESNVVSSKGGDGNYDRNNIALAPILANKHVTVTLNNCTIELKNISGHDIQPKVLLSKYCGPRCIANLFSGASRTLEIITENLQKIEVREDGTPQWNDGIKWVYQGTPEKFIYALMKRRFSGYMNMASNATKKLSSGVGKLRSGVGYVGKTLKKGVSSLYDSLKNRFTRKNSGENFESEEVQNPMHNKEIGGKRNKHSKRVAKNKQNKRKTRRH